MEVQHIRKIIPEQTMEYDQYVAEDGSIFHSEIQCIEYEKRLHEKLRITSHPVYMNKRDIRTWPDDESASLYYFRSEEDYLFFKDDIMKLSELDFRVNDFHDFGPGYYIFVYVDGGDGPDFYYLHNVDHYIPLLETEFQNWKNEISDAILQMK